MPVIPSTTQVVSPQISAKSIIKRALRLNGAKQSGEEPSPSELQDCLEALNAMLDSWNTEHLVVYKTARTELTLIAGQSSFTIGIGEDLEAPRPSHIDNATLILVNGTTEQPLRILTDDEWANLREKTQSGQPTQLYFDGDKTIYFDFVTDAANTLVLYTWQQLSQISDLNEKFTFPTGFKDAIDHNLAVRLAPEFGVGLADIADVVQTANVTKTNMKRLNIKPRKMRCEEALLNSRRKSYNVLSDTNR